MIEPFAIEFKDEWYSVSVELRDKKPGILTITNVLTGEEVTSIVQSWDKDDLEITKQENLECFAQYKYIELLANVFAERVKAIGNDDSFFIGDIDV